MQSAITTTPAAAAIAAAIAATPRRRLRATPAGPFAFEMEKPGRDPADCASMQLGQGRRVFCTDRPKPDGTNGKSSTR